MNFPSRVKNDKRWGPRKLKNTNIQEIIKGRRTYGGATEGKEKTDRKEHSHGFQEFSTAWSTDSNAIKR